MVAISKITVGVPGPCDTCGRKPRDVVETHLCVDCGTVKHFVGRGHTLSSEGVCPDRPEYERAPTLSLPHRGVLVQVTVACLHMFDADKHVPEQAYEDARERSIWT